MPAPKPTALGTWLLGLDYFGPAPYVTPPTVPVDRLRELLTSHRRESLRVDELTRTDAPLGVLDGVKVGGTIDHSIHQTIRSTGTITHVRKAGDPAPEWPRRRIQPWYTLTDPVTAEQYAWPQGVFIPATPTEHHLDGEVVTAVDLYDKLLILDRNKVPHAWGYDAGTNPITAIADLITDTGETSMALTETTQTLSSTLTWDPGTSRLQIINDLLGAANYFSLWVDGHGQFRAEPNIPPSRRPIRWDFRDDRSSIYVPNWTHEADGFNVPNHVQIVGRADSEDPPMVANAYNEDPESDWSIPTVGATITHTQQDVDATDQVTLDAIAQRRLVELSQVTSKFQIQHAYLPDLALNDAVLLVNERHDTDALCVVQAMSIPTTTGGLVTTTLREVVR